LTRQTIIINGNNFTDLGTFYNEIDRVLTQNIDWATGHNLDAFNDLLRGGFGVYEYEESVKIVWTVFSKSRKELGLELQEMLVGIIKSHSHIEFITED
jgi:RNAse (barnase) inhibitor barstar